VLLVAIFIDGLAVGPVNPLSATITQERVPAALLGRVQGMRTAISFMMIPLGRGLAGLLIDPLGLRTIFLGIAAGFLLIALGVTLNPVFRHMRPADDGAMAARPQPALSPMAE
jgi:MFS family permease